MNEQNTNPTPSNPQFSLSSSFFKNDGFMGYFEDEVDYPKNVAVDILPLGTLWCYISSDFLNGFINYVKPVKGYLINHYQTLDEPLDKGEGRVSIQNQDPETSGSQRWITAYAKTKLEKYQLLTKEENACHPKFHEFRDDVLLLAKAENIWFFFWFDMDCSDCFIGRFKTNEPDETVIKKFTEYCHERNTDFALKSKDEMLELPEHYLKAGWKSW